jgi:hypothetical protein
VLKFGSPIHINASLAMLRALNDALRVVENIRQDVGVITFSLVSIACRFHPPQLVKHRAIFLKKLPRKESVIGVQLCQQSMISSMWKHRPLIPLRVLDFRSST